MTGLVRSVTPEHIEVIAYDREIRFRVSDGANMDGSSFDQCFVPTPEEAESIKNSYELFMQLMTTSQVLDALNSDMYHKRLTFDEGRKIAAVFSEILRQREQSTAETVKP